MPGPRMNRVGGVPVLRIDEQLLFGRQEVSVRLIFVGHDRAWRSL